jgi:hypothetical protein
MLRWAAIAPACRYHAGAERCRAASKLPDRTRQIRMRSIDARVDYADQYAIAGGEPMASGG